ncbi:hypothetical protein B0O79_2067 [Flavobacteriaceae bacterium MAR_2009_75]|nr:hypothetical protein B0O79_2067 [Flavobacteriaceae bacterium MAR_2009_75]
MHIKSSTILKSFFIFSFLFISCSKDDNNTEEEVIEDESTIVVYEDIKFAVDEDGVDSKRFFSTSSGQLYTFSEIDEEIGYTVDLIWYDMSPTNSGFLFWEEPNDLFGDLSMPGARAIKIENYEPSMSPDDFDNIENSDQLMSLTVENSNSAMGPVNYPLAILFENADGKKGIIKMKSNDGEFMTVDIKVMK